MEVSQARASPASPLPRREWSGQDQGRVGVLGKCSFLPQAPSVPEASVTFKDLPGVRLSQGKAASSSQLQPHR